MGPVIYLSGLILIDISIRMSDQSLIWGCCNPTAEDSENLRYIKCGSCKKAYHKACLQFSDVEEFYNWICPSCTPKSINAEGTSARKNVTLRPPKRPALNSPPMTVESAITKDTIRDIVYTVLHEEDNPNTGITRDEVKNVMEEVMQKEINGLMLKIRNDISTFFKTELKSIKDELGEVKESMNFINNQYEDFMKEHVANKEMVKSLQLQNEKLQTVVDEQNTRINQLEQHARAGNVEIQCVPEKKDENLVEVVKQLSKAIDMDLKDPDVHHVTRIAKFNRQSNRPRSIIVQFSSPRTRDTFMAAAIKFNKSSKDGAGKLNSSHIGLHESTPIYITEHLSPTNKALHAAARLRAKEKGYKYVWVRSGRIYVRKMDTAEYIFIKDSSSLDKIV